MAQNYDKQIEQLRLQLAEVEAKKEKEEREAEVLQRVYGDLKSALAEAEISIDTFVQYAYRDIKRAVIRIDREKAREEGAEPPKESPTPKRATTKKRTKRGKAKKKMPVKIPAGQYRNIPPNPEEIHTVNEKGPRPKLIKAYVEEIGIDRFLEECRIEG
jgi:hypothetical protein